MVDSHVDDLSVQAVPEKSFENSVGMKMVRINKGYWIGAHEVTERQFGALMGLEAMPELPRIAAGRPSRQPSLDSDYPVRYISAADALRFCAQLTASDHEAGLLPEGAAYSLPTERQWVQCVADIKFWQEVTAASIIKLSKDKNCYKDLRRGPLQQPSTVGSKQPNRLGLFDMMGNVSEFCLDWYSTSGPAPSRVIRGTDYSDLRAEYWCVSNRYGIGGPRSPTIGFRVVLAPRKTKGTPRPRKSSDSAPDAPDPPPIN